MINKAKLWLLRWLVGWGRLIDGVVAVVTLSVCRPALGLTATKFLSRARYRIERR